MHLLAIEPGQSLELGQTVQVNEKTMYVWAIDGDHAHVSPEEPQYVNKLQKYAELKSRRRDSWHR